MSKTVSGLTTEQGLLKLRDEIKKFIDTYHDRFHQRPLTQLLSYLCRKSSCYSLLSLTCIFVVALLLLITAGIADGERFYSGSSAWLAIEGILLLALTTFTLTLIYLSLSKSASIHTILKQNLLEEIYECVRSNHWSSNHYPSLHCPISPCVSLQWCVRDGVVVNLPTCLLVEGDVIMMRPGFAAPELCTSLEEEGRVLQVDEMFVKELSPGEGLGPQPRTPLMPERFLLQETPYLRNLRTMLDDTIKRPLSFVENEKITVCNKWLARRVLPLVLIVFLVINGARYFYFDPEGAHWAEMLIILPIHGILPLLAVVFPFLWICVNTYGQAHMNAVCEVYRSLGSNPNSVDSLSSCSNMSMQQAHTQNLYKQVFWSFLAMLCGRRPMPCPGFEMLHTFGSVTAFCCVDKKGILSWPNASAEKICFFSSQDKQSSSKEEEGEVKVGKKGGHTKKRSKAKMERNHSGRIEVLDLTHESGKDPTGIEFDDPHWKDHLSSLKPLGLASLLNTCSQETVEWYTQFMDHVSVASQDNEDTVAVVNRRCMCPLSQEIGFTKEAVKIFNHEVTFGVYRQVPLEESEKEKQNRARSFIQHKIPMPHQVSVLVRDKISGMCQLMTQGTGDVVLDCCSDFWNGTDLQTLTEVDRKKVLDFYHRNSMIAYCTAFAYKPIPKPVSDWSSDVYTELVESPTTTRQLHGEDMGIFLEQELNEPGRPTRCHSVDSLIELSPSNSMKDVSVGRMLQSHQTFIGMVSLQYQARQEFVQMIDKLEMACIRFVSFSKENEVRSRIFSEKLGLEAGWNCHVSLMPQESVASASSSCRNLPSLSNVNTVGGAELAGEAGKCQDTPMNSLSVASPQYVPRTHSAPSFVNTDEIQVKFAANPLPIIINGEDQSGSDSNEISDIVEDENESEMHKLLDGCTNRTEKHKLDVIIPEIIEEEEDRGSRNSEKQHLLTYADNQSCSRTDDSDSSSDEEDDDDDDDEDDGDFDLQSTSHYTSSYITEYTEDSLTGALDNRAHLPRGIENIRPHLQSVDNVPLLVNLFTDCTPQATCEMVKIMQEYGEVVLILGSSLNTNNTPVFLQADCSMAIEPLLPHLCASRPTTCQPVCEDSVSPSQLASRLLSVPCAFNFASRDNIKFTELIMEARHYVFAMRNCFYLMVCCLLACVVAQLVGGLVLLPPVMACQHVLWLVVLVIPALSLSLMGTPNEARTMSMSTHKNVPYLNTQVITEFIVQFSARFIPSILVAVLCFALVLYSSCQTTSSLQCSLYEFSSSQASSYNQSMAGRWTEKFKGSLLVAQNIFHFLFVFYLVVISMSLVHWQDQLWHKLPFKNVAWSITSAVILVLQFIFSLADVYARQKDYDQIVSLSQIHPAVWGVGSIWPLCAIALNEVVKRRAIKLVVRRQRRARLDFDTKLGMNSPF